jgi:hypothetical protein
MTSPAVLVIVRTSDPHRQAEALRAALGLTLRGARVEVAIDTGAIDTGAIDTGAIDTGAIDTGAIDTGAIDASAVDQVLATPLARRAAATLRSFGHPVGIVAGNTLAAALARAGRVEVWT